MNKLTQIIQLGDGSTPLDSRELTDVFLKEQVEFALEATPRIQSRVHKSQDKSWTLLEKINLGGSAAENKIQTIYSYCLDTDAFL